MKPAKSPFLFAFFFLLFSLFVSCGDGAGGSGEPATSISYTGKKGSDIYTLTITKNAARAAYQPVTDDDYTLTLSSSGETFTSDGTVIVVDGQTFTLIPFNETGSATVTVSGSSITEISGEGFDWNNDITFNTPGILDQSMEIYGGDIVLKGVRGQSIIQIAGTGEIIADTGGGNFKFHTLLGEDQFDAYAFDWPTWETGTVSISEGNVTALNCNGIGITELIFNDASNLTWLVCNDNNLKSLDVTENVPNLEHLECNSNELESLDVSGLEDLVYLSCLFNKLESLDLSNCESLEVVLCEHNELTSIKITDNNSLHSIVCRDNELSVEVLINMFSHLHDTTDVTNYLYLTGGLMDCGTNPGTMDFFDYITDHVSQEGNGFRKGWRIGIG